MASTFSPIAVLQEIISITNIEKNKLNSVTQIKLAHAEAKHLLPEFEEWESSFKSLRTDNEVLRQEFDETLNRLQEQTKLTAIQKTLTERISQKSREAQRAQEEVKPMKIKEDLLGVKWTELKQTTDEQLRLIINLLTAQTAVSAPKRI